MAGPRNVRIVYQSKNNTTGLTDVKGQIYFNQVAQAVGLSARLFTELDAVNAPGLYYLDIAAANLVTWGLVAGGTFTLEARVDSVTLPAAAIYKQDITYNNVDDLMAALGAPVGASLSADIAAIYARIGAPTGTSVSADIAGIRSDTSAIKTDLETGPYSLQNILASITALSNSSISNGVGFVLPIMLVPQTGINTYKIPITINDNKGALLDPASNSVTVGIKNVAGVDRGSYLVGETGVPLTVQATRDSVGQYHVIVEIPSTAPQEEILISFSYTLGTNPMVRYGQTQTLNFDNGAGTALQSTLLAVQTKVNGTNSIVSDAGFGNAAIANLLNSGTFGLAALHAILTHATHGLPQIKADTTDLKGTGFASARDSNKAISDFVRTNIYVGGRAV